MINLESEKILFTGAGFTHNFGTPLAEGLWGIIFNNQLVQQEQRIKRLLLDNNDFESVYQTIMHGDYSESERHAMKKALSDTYEKLDSIIRDWIPKLDAPYPVNICKVQEMIDLFSKKNKKGFFFTLNQDLFIERHYYNGDRPVIPGIQPKQEWFSTSFNMQLRSTDYCVTPSKEFIEVSKEEILSSSKFFYIKLHGSQNWLSSEGNQQMVIGRGKADQIWQEPILSWYFEIFKAVVLHEKRKILIIGYGFKDPHINKVISEAVDKYGLKVYLVSPESIAIFKTNINKSEYGEKILMGLSGYYQCNLLQMFRSDGSITQFYQDLREQFFGLSQS